MYQEIETKPTQGYRIDCTGDVVNGDRIRWSEAVYSGSHRNPIFEGERTIEAEVVADSYGAAKQQHTFSLLVVRAEDTSAPSPGERIRRKGRNIYRNGCYRAVWKNEAARRESQDEKHNRGDAARTDRETRRAVEGYHVG